MFQRGQLLLSVVLILGAALAGCLGDEDTPPATPGTDDGTGTDTGTEGGDGDPGTGDTGGDGGPSLGEAPSAVFEVLTEGDVTAGANVTFNASASSDPEGTNLTYAWDFGDNATGEGVEAVHVYAEAGNYTVVLNVTDEDGRSSETNQTITVAAGAVGDFSATLSGTITAPHPLLVLTPGGSDLDTYKTRGAAEGTTFEVHEVTDVPTNAATVSFELATSTQYVQYVIFDADGNQLALRNFPTAPSKITLDEEDAQHGHYFVFVYSALFPSAAYEIAVSVA